MEVLDGRKETHMIEKYEGRLNRKLEAYRNAVREFAKCINEQTGLKLNGKDIDRIIASYKNKTDAEIGLDLLENEVEEDWGTDYLMSNLSRKIERKRKNINEILYPLLEKLPSLIGREKDRELGQYYRDQCIKHDLCSFFKEEQEDIYHYIR